MEPSFKFVRVRAVHVPTRANQGDAGMDFYVPNDLTVDDLIKCNTNTYISICSIYANNNEDKTYTKEDITNFVRHKYLYNPVTINRCFDKFIKCGVIRINKDNYVILNDNFNVAKTIRNSIYFDNGDTAGVVSDFAVVVNFSVPAP